MEDACVDCLGERPHAQGQHETALLREDTCSECAVSVINLVLACMSDAYVQSDLD